MYGPHKSRCVGFRIQHLFLKGDRCLLCGKWRKGKEPDRRTAKGRPKLSEK